MTMLRVLIAVATIPLLAHAQLDAKHYYEEGTKAFDLGEFKRAVENYRSAYELKPDPVLLYNIAQAYRLGNDLEQAVFFYRSYLRRAPEARNRGEIEERIATLESEIAKRRSAVVAAPPNSPLAPGSKPPAVDHVEPAPAPAPLASEPSPLVSSAPPVGDERPAGEAPVYRRGWFWGVIAAIVVVVVGVGVGVGAGAAASSGTGPPASHFGTVGVF